MLVKPQRKHGPKAEMNVVPYIDVMLVLLVIFMVTAPFVHTSTIDLPAVDGWLERWRGLGPDAEAMDRVNPVYIPRNALVEEALAAATDGDLTPLHRLLEAVTAPYEERPGLERYAAPGPQDDSYRTFCGT